MSASELARLVKSNSSRWIHDTFPDMAYFAWQAGYGAFDVFMSGSAEPEKCIEILRSAFEAEHVGIKTHRRGQDLEPGAWQAAIARKAARSNTKVKARRAA